MTCGRKRFDLMPVCSMIAAKFFLSYRCFYKSLPYLSLQCHPICKILTSLCLWFLCVHVVEPVPGDGEDSDSQRIVDAFISEVYLFDRALKGKQLELGMYRP